MTDKDPACNNTWQQDFARISEQVRQIKWRRLALALAIFVVISFVFAYLVQTAMTGLKLPLYNVAWVAHVTVFAVTLVTNLSILVPVPFAVSIMVGAARALAGEGWWIPFTMAAVGAVGGAIGEMSGYYAGYLGKKIAIPEHLGVYEAVEGWVNRWGFWAILVLAVQPVIPFDIGGFVAGAARMPVRKFFPALVLGKFPKYVIIIYLGLGFIRFMPFLRG